MFNAQKLGGFAVVAAVLLALPSSADAGMKNSQPVTVNSDHAYGSLGSARNSENWNEYIMSLVAGEWAWMYFLDANGNGGGCTTSDPALIATAAAVGPSSSVYVSWDETTGVCSNIHVRNESISEVPR
jgi:hypothetical protein